jgi:LytS/YehU family sensor histidine kinase
MNLPLVKVQPLSPATRLILSDQEMHNLYASGRLSVRNHDYVELFRRDSDSGLIFSSRVSRSSIGESVTRITLNILGIGLFSIVVIVLLGLLLVRTLSRMRTFEEKQIRARLEMLQAKMNPHFLFNTLDSMIGVVLDNDRDTLLKILRSLSYMLHMSVRKKEDIITLADELRYITSYVELQRVRYPDSFDFTLNADKALLGLYVYRFSIQPLVENCFVHGVAEQPSRHICITVTVEKKDGALFVTVTDNGPGCTPEMRKRLTKIFHDDKMISNNGIGLSAVHSRIHTMHGKRYGLRLLPPGESFGIQAVLPVIRKRG